jgi:hypothetical protein
MTKNPIPDEIRRFILTSVPSVPYLEALLLLRSQPSDTWDAALVARRLYVVESHALALLQALGEAGFAEPVGENRYRFGPGPGPLMALIDALAQTYSSSLREVTELIHGRVDKRALQFADAFRWTRKEN